MADQEHLDILKQGVKTWNQWRKQHPDRIPDLARADLRETNLRKIDFHRADLRSADLRKVDLSEANLSQADLTSIKSSTESISSLEEIAGANLCGAKLVRANLGGAFLHGAKLTQADLAEAFLQGTDLGEADLSKANLAEADLCGADLYEAGLGGTKLTRADLSGTDLRRADLSEANLTGADLSDARLAETNFTKAILADCRIYGISAWDVELEGATQDSLIITHEDQPTITVDNLEVAQFIYLLLNHKKLREVLNAVTERGVLLLGRFSGGGLEVLQAVAAKLRKEKYLPIIFDFERPQDRNYTETVKTLAGLSRFIIADLSGPSVPQELYATVPHFKIPFVPIIEASRKPYSMAVDLLEYPWVVRPPITFASTEELVQLMSAKIIAPAEEKHQERQKLLDELFN